MPPMTPAPLHTALLVVHVASAAYWFGLTAGVPRRVRTALDAQDATPIAALLARDRVGAVLAPVVGWGTGLALVFAAGGFRAVAPRYHAALALGLAWIAVGTALARLLRKVATADRLDAATRSRLRARVGATTGVGHLLWVVLLTTMVYRGR